MISFDINEKECVVTVKGHAGYGEAGKDIVCAGASMLFYAFAEAEHKAGELMALKSEPGDCMVMWRKSRAARRRLEVLAAGGRLLERRYPDYVRVTIGEKTKDEC